MGEGGRVAGAQPAAGRGNVAVAAVWAEALLSIVGETEVTGMITVTRLFTS